MSKIKIPISTITEKEMINVLITILMASLGNDMMLKAKININKGSIKRMGPTATFDFDVVIKDDSTPTIYSKLDMGERLYITKIFEESKYLITSSKGRYTIIKFDEVSQDLLNIVCEYPVSEIEMTYGEALDVFKNTLHEITLVEISDMKLKRTNFKISKADESNYTWIISYNNRKGLIIKMIINKDWKYHTYVSSITIETGDSTRYQGVIKIPLL